MASPWPRIRTEMWRRSMCWMHRWQHASNGVRCDQSGHSHPSCPAACRWQPRSTVEWRGLHTTAATSPRRQRQAGPDHHSSTTPSSAMCRRRNLVAAGHGREPACRIHQAQPSSVHRKPLAHATARTPPAARRERTTCACHWTSGANRIACPPPPASQTSSTSLRVTSRVSRTKRKRASPRQSAPLPSR